MGRGGPRRRAPRLPGRCGRGCRGDCPLPKLIAEQVEKLLGVEIREVVGDFELADAGGEATTQVAGSNHSRVDDTGLCTTRTFIEIENVEECQ